MLEEIYFTGCLFTKFTGKYEPNAWFNGQQEPVDILVGILAKQPNLRCLELVNCELTEEQK